MSYGVPNDNTDATKRAGRLAPSLNALADAVDTEASERLALRARLDTAEPKIVTLENKVGTLEEKDTVTQSQLDSAVNPVKSKNTSQDSHLKRIDKKIETIQAALVAGDKDLPPGTTLVPPLPVPSPEYPDLPPMQNPVLTPDGWQEASGGGGAVEAKVFTYHALSKTGVAIFDEDGVSTTRIFRNAFRESPYSNDTIVLALNVDETDFPFMVGILHRAGGYAPPVLGPFTTSVEYPIGSNEMPYQPNYTSDDMFTRDWADVLGMGNETLIFRSTTGEPTAFNPHTGLNATLPPLPSSSYLSIVEVVEGAIIAASGTGNFFKYTVASGAWEQITLPTNPNAPSIYLTGFFENGKLVVFRYAKSSALGGVKFWKMIFDADGVTEVEIPGAVNTSATGAYVSNDAVIYLGYNTGHLWVFISGGTSRTNLTETMSAFYFGPISNAWFKAVNRGGFYVDAQTSAPGAPRGTWANNTQGALNNRTAKVDPTGTFWIKGKDNDGSFGGLYNWLTYITPAGNRSTYMWINPDASLVSTIYTILPMNGTVFMGGRSTTDAVSGTGTHRSVLYQTDGITSMGSFIAPETFTAFTSTAYGVQYIRQAPEGGNRIMFVYSGPNSISYINDVTF